MTLIAAFRCKDGILLAADREEVTATAKRSVSKLRILSLGRLNVFAASAGNAATADLALAELSRALDAKDPTSADECEEIIRNSVTKVYRENIWKNPDRDRDEMDFSLVIAASDTKKEQQFLYRTAGIVPQPIQDYVCVGCGEDLANYFADRLYIARMSQSELTLLAAFIFREAKESVRHVGLGTDKMFIFESGGAGSMIGDMNTLERDLPSFEDAIKKFWKDTALLPQWLTDERLDMGKMHRTYLERLKADLGHKKENPGRNRGRRG
jgi:20S proteasome alpha/beta subunit